MSEWNEASSEVLSIASQLIRDHHRHLMQVNICFLFRDEAQKKGGKRILARCEKISPKLQVLQDYQFLIWLSEDDYQKMTVEQRTALIDHELCHIALGENGYGIAGHDVEEFHQIIERYGLWDVSLKKIEIAMETRQMTLGEQIENLFGRVGTVTTENLQPLSND